MHHFSNNGGFSHKEQWPDLQKQYLYLFFPSLHLKMKHPFLTNGFSCIKGLRLKDIQVPDVVIYGSTKGVTLNCSYDLEDDDLYSIKWFKQHTQNGRETGHDNSSSRADVSSWNEFYRFQPSLDIKEDYPDTQVYRTKGIHVDVSSFLL